MERLDSCLRRNFGCVGRKTESLSYAPDCPLGDYDPDLQEDLYLHGTTKSWRSLQEHVHSFQGAHLTDPRRSKGEDVKCLCLIVLRMLAR